MHLRTFSKLTSNMPHSLLFPFLEGFITLFREKGCERENEVRRVGCFIEEVKCKIVACNHMSYVIFCLFY